MLYSMSVIHFLNLMLIAIKHFVFHQNELVNLRPYRYESIRARNKGVKEQISEFTNFFL